MPKDPNDPATLQPGGPDVTARQRCRRGSPGGGAGCLYRPVREEDVNVDLGNQFAPAIPPPPCVGDEHVIDQSTSSCHAEAPSTAAGAHAPLCDKRLVVLQNSQNVNADFFLMTNFRPTRTARTSADGDPGRIVGLVSTTSTSRATSSRSGTASRARSRHPGRDLPARRHGAERQPAVRRDNWRLFTTVDTSPEGTYEALLPSTETFNCPIPQGPCPGMYRGQGQRPGRPRLIRTRTTTRTYLTATSAWDVWPGTTDQLDTPLDPISGTGCETRPSGTPELLQVDSRPRARRARAVRARKRHHRGQPADHDPGRLRRDRHRGQRRPITLTDPRGALQSRTFTGLATPTQLANLDQRRDRQLDPDTTIVHAGAGRAGAHVPARPEAAADPQRSRRHRRSRRPTASRCTCSGSRHQPYNPPVVNVGRRRRPNAHAIQNAIDAAPPAACLCSSPGHLQRERR